MHLGTMSCTSACDTHIPTSDIALYHIHPYIPLFLKVPIITLYHIHPLVPEGSYQDVEWRDVRVGQVLKVLDNELFPADLLCLHSDLPENVCFIKTTNLVRGGAVGVDGWMGSCCA